MFLRVLGGAVGVPVVVDGVCFVCVVLLLFCCCFTCVLAIACRLSLCVFCFWCLLRVSFFRLSVCALRLS